MYIPGSNHPPTHPPIHAPAHALFITVRLVSNASSDKLQFPHQWRPQAVGLSVDAAEIGAVYKRHAYIDIVEYLMTVGRVVRSVLMP